jgi:hypothetical protein
MAIEIELDERLKKKFKIFSLYLKMQADVSEAYTTLYFYDGSTEPDSIDYWYSKTNNVSIKEDFGVNQIIDDLFTESDLWDKLFDNVHEDINYSTVDVYIGVDEKKVWFDAEYESYGSEDSYSEGTISEDWMEKLEGRGVYTAKYSGGGDDGSIHDDVEFDGDDDYNGSEYQNYAYQILYDNYGGWENNDGGEGTIIINTIEGTWEIGHTWFETQMVDARNPDVYFYF